MRRAVLEARPDVLEIHSPYVAALSALSVPRRGYGIRTFVWHADFIDTYLRGGLERRLGARGTDVVVEPLWSWVRTIARGCSATFVASRWQKEKLASHDVPRLVHLPFGVDKDRFTPRARDEAVRRELLAGRPGPLLLAIGRFAVEKRWDVVLDAFLRLRETRDATLVILGDGPERDTMRLLVAGRNDVTFLGFEKDRARIAAIMASADALIHGCPYETFGLGIAEVVASGLPIVVPDEGGAFEQATDASEVYRALDVEACAAATARMIERLAREPHATRAAAERAALRVASERAHFERLFEIYRELLAHPDADVLPSTLAHD